MSDSTLSLAIKEAYASAPADVIIYDTLEITHPAFTTPIRVVRDNTELVAGLEKKAPNNPGETVTFVGYAFDVVPPEVSFTGPPQLQIEIDNVSRDILAQVELAQGSSELIKVIYRQYISSDLSEPQNNPPLTMDIFSISANVFRIKAVAGFQNFANKIFPRLSYTAETFPGLLAS